MAWTFLFLSMRVKDDPPPSPRALTAVLPTERHGMSLAQYDEAKISLNIYTRIARSVKNHQAFKCNAITQSKKPFYF